MRENPGYSLKINTGPLRDMFAGFQNKRLTEKHALEEDEQRKKDM